MKGIPGLANAACEGCEGSDALGRFLRPLVIFAHFLPCHDTRGIQTEVGALPGQGNVRLHGAFQRPLPPAGAADARRGRSQRQ